VAFDERMTQPIVIPFGAELPAVEDAPTPHRVLGAEARAARHHADLEGLVVDVEITDWPSPTRGARGGCWRCLAPKMILASMWRW